MRAVKQEDDKNQSVSFGKGLNTKTSATSCLRIFDLSIEIELNKK